MPASRRTQPVADRWLLTAALGYHAGTVSADTYQRLIHQLRRHADPTLVLDDHAATRTDCEHHPE